MRIAEGQASFTRQENCSSVIYLSKITTLGDSFSIRSLKLLQLRATASLLTPILSRSALWVLSAAAVMKVTLWP